MSLWTTFMVFFDNINKESTFIVCKTMFDVNFGVNYPLKLINAYCKSNIKDVFICVHKTLLVFQTQTGMQS